MNETVSSTVYIVRYAVVIPIWLLHFVLTFQSRYSANVSAIAAVVNILVMAAGDTVIQREMEKGAGLFICFCCVVLCCFVLFCVCFLCCFLCLF